MLSGPVAAQPVTVGQLTVYGDNTLSFDIAWGPDGGRVTPWSDSVWVLIDYKDPASGGLRRLPVTSATLTAVSSTWSLAKVRTVPGNTTGFFVDGQARALGTAATLTVRVTPQAGVTISKPCVYALDYPPLATYGVDGGDNTVALVGTAPFCGSLINDSGTTMTFPSSAASWTLPAGYRVNEYTDLTGNSGLVDCGASRPTVTGSSGALRCGSGVVTLSATASAGATIDWYSAATGGTLLLSGNMAYNPSVATSTTYYAQARNTGTACTSALRTAVAATVNALPTVSVSVSQTLCFNDSPTALTATPSGGHGSPQVYAWERSTDGSSWNSVSGSTNTYAPGASTLTAYYRAQVTQATTGCTSAYSTPATITVQPQFTPGAIATTGQTLCAGGTPTIISNATAASGGNGVITYSWYKNGTVIAGATATTYTPPPTDATTAATVVYTRKAKDGLCNTTDTLSSGSWTLTVVAEPTISLVPIARALCFNEVAATLTATPAGGHGTPQVYAWQRSTDGSSWSSVFGSTNTYAPGASTLTAYYRAMVTQTTTGCVSAYSTSATITVRPQFTPGAIATTGQSLCAGGTPTIISNATAASGGNGVFTYSWYKNGTVIAGATATTYTPPPTDATTAATVVYTRKAKDGLCNTTATLSTGSWTMTVVADPTISIAASSQTVCFNDSPAALTATPAGGNGTVSAYAWQRSTNGSSWSNVSGTTNTYSPGASTLTAYYRAQVTQTTTGCTSAYSTPATITAKYCDGPTDSNCSYKTLTIGTTTWAGCNSTYTTVSGTGGQWVFAAKPDTYTPFVQWNKPSKAWSAIALGAQAAWTSATSTASSWSNGFPCPEGWRLPTLAEFQALNDAGSVWGAVAAKGNALAGRFYGSGASSCSLPTPSDCIFLPALGERSKSDGSLSDQGGYGYYWSSEQYNSTSGYSMNFHSNNSSAEYSYDKAYGFSARCVK